MKTILALLALACVSAGLPPFPTTVKKAVSPKMAAVVTGKAMVVVHPPVYPKFSAGFELVDPTNTLASINFLYGSTSGNYTMAVGGPMSAFTNSLGVYPATFQWTNLMANQPITMVAQAVGTNGINSVTNSNEIIWNMTRPVQLWFKNGAGHVAIRSVIGRRYWVYFGNAANGPWGLSGVLDGNGGIVEMLFTPKQMQFIKVVEGN